ncbi:MAG: hypothetical protein ACQEQ0_08010 [Bacteroidota bacterium]
MILKRLYRFVLIMMVLLLVHPDARGQIYNNWQNNTLNPVERVLHRPGQNLHGSIKPLRLDQIENLYNTDSLLQRGIPSPSGRENIFGRFVSDDLFRWETDSSMIRINPLFNFEYGHDGHAGKSWFVNTRGAMVEGRLGPNIGFYADIHENQATFPEYLDQFANDRNIVPGQGERKKFGEDGHDYAQSTGYLSYNAGRWFNFQLGFGKNFIGDGHRSLFLSDNAYSYPYLKMTATFMKAKYMMMVAEFKHHDRLPESYGDTRYPNKYGAIHYLNWNLGDRFSLGLFESVIWAPEDTVGYRGIDVNYLMPLVVFRPVEYNLGSPDNVTIGMNLKYIPWKDAALYGQFVIGEFKHDEVFSGDKWWANKHGFLAGMEVFNLFGIPNLDFQTEYSQVRPYTYSHYDPTTSYAHLYQELGHPLGANFRESVTFLRYRINRWHFELKNQYAMKGLDPAGETTYGGNIHVPNTNRPGAYGHTIGQGLKSHLLQTQLNLNYLINPRNNMNITLGFRHREMTNDRVTEKGNYVYAAFRTSIRNFYYDYF